MNTQKVIIDGQQIREIARGQFIMPGQTILPHMKKQDFLNNGELIIKGVDDTAVILDKNALARHILCLGAIGSGKSVTMYHIIKDIRSKATKDDVFVFFDAKGDYLKEFYKHGDYVVSNDLEKVDGAINWNIFEDIMSIHPEKREDGIREISASLFKEDIERSSAPVFSIGARDIFSGILIAITRDIDDNGTEWDNEKLVQWLKKATIITIRNLLVKHKDLAWIRNLVSNDMEGANQSFLVHLNQNIFNIFSGEFAKGGGFSMKRCIKEKGGKAIFLEYDLANGNILRPIYTLLIDLAMKESLGRSKTEGNVYFILDEFPLIPKLNYMDNALNFGRSLGVKVIAGIQNVGQVLETYGESGGMSIISGFGTIFTFKLNDEVSRQTVKGRHGANKVVMKMLSTNVAKGVQDIYMDSSVIEDSHISDLRIGQCIISPFNGEPFKFYPVMYEGR